MSSRFELRNGSTDVQRIRFLENDADEFERGMAGLRKLLTGILVSTTTASVLLSINIVVTLAQRH